MKKLLVALALLAPSFAMAATPKEVRDILNNSGLSSLQASQLGTEVVDGVVKTMRANYNFSVQGGSSSATMFLKAPDGSSAAIPNKAIIKSVYIDTVSSIVDVSTGVRIAFGANTDVDLKASTASGSFTGIIAGIPVDTAATAVKMTADRPLTMKVTGGNISSGQLNVFVTYLVSE